MNRFPPLAPPEPSNRHGLSFAQLPAPRWGEVLPWGEIFTLAFLLVLLAMT